MSNLVTLVNNLATHLGGKYKDLSADILALETAQGDLSTLSTTAKDNLVGAINELKAAYDSLPDDMVTSTEMATAIQTGLDSLISGNADAYKNLIELSDYMAADQTAATAIMESLANRLRFDAPQNLTAAQQAQGQANLHVPSIESHSALEAGVGDYANANFVGTFDTASQ